MAVLSTLSAIPGLLRAWVAASVLAQNLQRPGSLIRFLLTLGVLNSIRRVVMNRYFHKLSHIPGDWTSTSYFFTAIGQIMGKNHYFLPKAHAKFGRVVRVAPDIVSIADKDAIHEILVKSDYPKSIIHEALELHGQSDLFTARDKTFHRNRRRMVTPAFGLQYLRSLEPIMQACIKILIQTLDSQLENASDDQINVCSFMNRLSLDIIGETAFGQTFDMVRHDNHPFPDAVSKAMKHSQQQGFNPFLRWFVPVDKSYLGFGKARVQDRRNAMAAAAAAGDSAGGRRVDLLQFLIDAQAKALDEEGKGGNVEEKIKEGKILTDKAVEIEALMFLVAGSETSSTAMTHTLMFLVQNPHTLEKLQQELDLATASNPKGALPTHDQIRNLPYLTACIHESMRIRPVAATGIPRAVEKDTTLAGVFIPKGTIVMANTAMLHWSDHHFPDPQSYIPERWIPEQSPYPPPEEFTFYPFSAGSRNCVGKNFAMMEMRLILATLVLTYQMKNVPGQRDDYVQFITTALATHSYRIHMKKRF